MARVPDQSTNRPDGESPEGLAVDGDPVPTGTAAKDKPLTHAQRAKAEADAVQAKVDRQVLDAAESFVVIYPTGISVFVGTETAEVKTTVGGVETHVDAVGGHVSLPKGALIRANSVPELEEFRRLATLRFIDPVSPAEAP